MNIMNKVLKKLPFAQVLLVLFAVIVFVGCATGASPARGAAGGWISPMLSLTLSSGTANVYNGTISVERTNSAAGVTPVTRAGRVTTAGITEASLVANGAIRATLNLSYQGEEEFLVRFRAWVDEFSGHSIDGRVPNATGEASDRVLVLWRDPAGTWWDIRRAPLGSANTGGVRNPFRLGDGMLAYERDGGVVSIRVNRDNISQFAALDFYIVVLNRPLERPEKVDGDFTGYIMTFSVETPDRFAGHFHAYEVLVSTATALAVNPAR